MSLFGFICDGSEASDGERSIGSRGFFELGNGLGITGSDSMSNKDRPGKFDGSWNFGGSALLLCSLRSGGGNVD